MEFELALCPNVGLEPLASSLPHAAGSVSYFKCTAGSIEGDIYIYLLVPYIW